MANFVPSQVLWLHRWQGWADKGSRVGLGSFAGLAFGLGSLLRGLGGFLDWSCWPRLPRWLLGLGWRIAPDRSGLRRRDIVESGKLLIVRIQIILRSLKVYVFIMSIC